MADICIVYASGDREVAEKLVTLLSSQWNVWWDYDLTGDFRKKIPLEIKNSRCVVALWSPAASEKTATVGEDMKIALNNDVEIIPVVISKCEPMYGFGNLSHVELLDWGGDPQHPNFRQLQRKLATVIPSQCKPPRPASIANEQVQLPGFFLSVSSHETRLDPLPAIQAVLLFRAPLVLISAYDVLPERYLGRKATLDKIQGLLSDYRKCGGFILMDSGNYEASRRGDDDWNPDKLKQALTDTPHDWAFCFDDYDDFEDTNAAIDQVVNAVKRDRNFTDSDVLPIVHTSRHSDGSFDSTRLPELVFGVAQRLEPPLVAVPERELGSGIIERAKTVLKIRESLNGLPFYQPLHLLGTGNPWAMSILATAGADTFDGLEWCRIVVDHDSGHLYHDQHFDFFSFQGRRRDSTIMAQIGDDTAVNFAGRVAFHNLEYFSAFSKELKEAMHADNLEALATGMLGRSNMKVIKKKIPKLFQ